MAADPYAEDLCAVSLQTERLCLYPLSLGQLRRAAADPNGVAMEFGAAAQPFGFREMLSKRRIYAAKSDILRRWPRTLLLSTTWLLVDRNTRTVVGEAGFKGPPHMGAVEIGYGMRQFARNQGYMTEAVDSLCTMAWTQKEFPVWRIHATTSADNTASHRVLQKNAFSRASIQGKLWLWTLERAEP